MRMNPKFKIFVRLAFLVALTFSVDQVRAQPGGHGHPCPKQPCPPSVPISGIEILVAGGMVMGIRRYFQSKGLSKKS